MLLVAVGFVAGFSYARCARVESELLLGERSTLVERQSQYVTTLIVSSLFQPRRTVVLLSSLTPAVMNFPLPRLISMLRRATSLVPIVTYYLVQYTHSPDFALRTMHFSVLLGPTEGCDSGIRSVSRDWYLLR